MGKPFMRPVLICFTVALRQNIGLSPLLRSDSKDNPAAAIEAAVRSPPAAVVP